MPNRFIPYLKAIVHVLCLLPFVYLLNRYHNGTLAAEDDPVKYVTHFTGHWALWLLLADLAITPARRLHTSLAWMIRFRRMVGLYVFFYATLHLLTYVLLFSGYDIPTAMAGLKEGHLVEPWNQLKLIWPVMLDDVQKRGFIQAGLLAWTLLFVLTVTSPQRVLRAMGGKTWQRMHRLVYLAAMAVMVHYWWQMKAGVMSPWKDTAVLAVLLLSRAAYVIIKRTRRTAVVKAAATR